MKRLLTSLFCVLAFLIAPAYASDSDISGVWDFSGSYTTMANREYRAFQGPFSGSIYIDADPPIVDEQFNWECVIRSVSISGSFSIGDGSLPFSYTTQEPIIASRRMFTVTIPGTADTTFGRMSSHSFLIHFDSSSTAMVDVVGIFDAGSSSINYTGSALASR